MRVILLMVSSNKNPIVTVASNTSLAHSVVRPVPNTTERPEHRESCSTGSGFIGVHVQEKSSVLSLYNDASILGSTDWSPYKSTETSPGRRAIR